MRIVYIVKYIAQLGGLDRVLSFKMNYLAEKLGYEVFLITYEQGNHEISFPLSPSIRHEDINVRFFTRHKYGLLKRLYLYYKMRSVFTSRLNDKLDAIKPDIVVTLTDSYTLLDILMDLSGKYKIVVESHVERNGTIKQTDYLNNPIMHYITKQYDDYVLRCLKKSDAFVTLTKGDFDQWYGLTNKIVIPNPISIIPQCHSSLKNKRVVSIGRLEPQKGFDMLISAWKIVTEKYSDWSLDIYGDGGLRDVLIGQINDMCLSDSCHICSATNDIETVYLNSSIYVMSSRYEGFGLVLIEAMSFGIPCISFDCPYGPSDIIMNNEDGIMVESENVEELAKAICYLIENEDVRMNFGERARNDVNKYSAEKIMSKWNELFISLVN